MIDVYVTEPHYWRHLRPIWEALPGILRGTAYDATTKMDIRHVAPLVMCAGYDDAAFMIHCGRKVIYVEHGAGQAYPGETEMGNYSGGRGLDGVVLFICPSETVAQRWRARYPHTPAVAVGCPKMDAYIGVQHPAMPGGVAITFHWDVLVCPESRSAFNHYREGLSALVKLCEDYCMPLLAHAHPRWDNAQAGGSPGQMCRYWLDLGAEYTPFESEIFGKSSLLIADNTSLLYEFASLGRPVIGLNAPWFRRDVEHGLRFWSHAPRLQADNITELLDIVEDYCRLVDAVRWPPVLVQGPALVPYVYSHIDGHASERAVEAIREVVNV